MGLHGKTLVITQNRQNTHGTDSGIIMYDDIEC
jgi:hypothetical protein